MINFAVIGAGIISGRHLKAIDKHPNARLTAVADLDMEKAKKPPHPMVHRHLPTILKCWTAAPLTRS